MKRATISIYIIALTVLLAVSCGKKTSTRDNAQNDGQARKVNLVQGSSSLISGSTASLRELELSGEVSYDENKVIKIFPRSSGQVLQSPFSLGDKVEAGQVLAVIKSADVAGNYADVSSADADVAIAKRQMDNQEALYKNGIASEREFEEAKEDYQKALANKQKITSLIQINGFGWVLRNSRAGIVAPAEINRSVGIAEFGGLFVKLNRAAAIFFDSIAFKIAQAQVVSSIRVSEVGSFAI